MGGELDLFTINHQLSSTITQFKHQLSLSSTINYHSQLSTRDPETASSTPSKKRGATWETCQREDRALAKQVPANDPILNKVGKREDRWQRVADNLMQVGITRSWISCKNRMERLVKWQRSEETRSRQKTGEVEEVNEHLRNMIHIVLLCGSVSNNNLIKQDTKGKIAERKAKGAQGKQLRGRSKSSTLFKNQFAKEVEGVISGLREKAEEFRITIQEPKKAERERIAAEETAAREREKADRDRDLCEKLDVLIDSTRSTNESMQKLMSVIIQGMGGSRGQ
ncbi:hypothetical protein P167DRAFT_580487 [Morchella conica CCBAS932]|uniref:Myb-like domain-containing protein n=1 Tax=Morchella conica CCBAS932 TaxID=1392247 RepID=A0A3N4K7U1_9PEZI|nr:hypothetical protein P167DRAFT_580487 [Morchella conica CCBAS932]